MRSPTGSPSGAPPTGRRPIPMAFSTDSRVDRSGISVGALSRLGAGRVRACRGPGRCRTRRSPPSRWPAPGWRMRSSAISTGRCSGRWHTYPGNPEPLTLRRAGRARRRAGQRSPTTGRCRGRVHPVFESPWHDVRGAGRRCSPSPMRYASRSTPALQPLAGIVRLTVSGEVASGGRPRRSSTSAGSGAISRRSSCARCSSRSAYDLEALVRRGDGARPFHSRRARQRSAGAGAAARVSPLGLRALDGRLRRAGGRLNADRIGDRASASGRCPGQTPAARPRLHRRRAAATSPASRAGMPPPLPRSAAGGAAEGAPEPTSSSSSTPISRGPVGPGRCRAG